MRSFESSIDVQQQSSNESNEQLIDTANNNTSWSDLGNVKFAGDNIDKIEDYSVNIENVLGEEIPDGLEYWQDDVSGYSVYTPQINELKTVGNRRSLSEWKRIGIDAIISNFEYHKADDSPFELRDEQSVLVSLFLEAPNIPTEEKDKLSQYLSEDFKEQEFNRYFTLLSKELSKDDDFDSDLLMHGYTPKINGVPIKYDNGVENETTFGEIKDVLTGDYDGRYNLVTLIAIDEISKNVPYFQSLAVPEKVKKQIDALQKIRLEEYKEQYGKQCDRARKEYIEANINSSHGIRVNEDLKKKIVGEMPESYTDLEKSIYIYMKLCETLSYDGDYYYKDQVKDKNKQGIHENVSRLESINSEDGIVCYEFDYIFDDLLQDYDIKYLEKHNINEGRFSDSHKNSTFMADGTIVFADSTRSADEGDLINVKIGNNTNGIRCENYSLELQEKFRQAKEKVISELNKNPNRVSYSEIVKKYDTLARERELKSADKISFIFSELNKTNLSGMDLFSLENMLEQHILKEDGIRKHFHRSLCQNPDGGLFLYFKIDSLRSDNEKKPIEFNYDLSTKQISR